MAGICAYAPAIPSYYILCNFAQVLKILLEWWLILHLRDFWLFVPPDLFYCFSNSEMNRLIFGFSDAAKCLAAISLDIYIKSTLSSVCLQTRVVLKIILHNKQL